MTDRIDHAAEARDLLYRARPGSSWQGPDAAAQVHATLALVEQQRIAWVVALAQTPRDSWDYIIDTEAEAEGVRATIRAALGLDS